METISEVKKILREYLKEFPNENQRLLSDFLNRCSYSDLYDRGKSYEHITASALIINPIERKILLLNHKILKKYLQPGGHIENTDSSILEAALREANEETGIKKEKLTYYYLHSTENIPFDIDSHTIPENKEKNEPSHFHHDFRYLFFYTAGDKITPNSRISEEVKWISFSELNKDKTFSNLLEKIRKLLSLEFKTKLYYDKVINQVIEKKSSVQL